VCGGDVLPGTATAIHLQNSSSTPCLLSRGYIEECHGHLVSRPYLGADGDARFRCPNRSCAAPYSRHRDDRGSASNAADSLARTSTIPPSSQVRVADPHSPRVTRRLSTDFASASVDRPRPNNGGLPPSHSHIDQYERCQGRQGRGITEGHRHRRNEAAAARSPYALGHDADTHCNKRRTSRSRGSKYKQRVGGPTRSYDDDSDPYSSPQTSHSDSEECEEDDVDSVDDDDNDDEEDDDNEAANEADEEELNGIYERYNNAPYVGRSDRRHPPTRGDPNIISSASTAARRISRRERLSPRRRSDIRDEGVVGPPSASATLVTSSTTTQETQKQTASSSTPNHPNLPHQPEDTDTLVHDPSTPSPGQPSPDRSKPLGHDTPYTVTSHPPNEIQEQEGDRFPLTLDQLRQTVAHACLSHRHQCHWPSRNTSQGVWEIQAIVGHVDTHHPDGRISSRYAVMWGDWPKSGIDMMKAKDFVHPCIVTAYNVAFPRGSRPRERMLAITANTSTHAHDNTHSGQVANLHNAPIFTSTTTPVRTYAYDVKDLSSDIPLEDDSRDVLQRELLRLSHLHAHLRVRAQQQAVRYLTLPHNIHTVNEVRRIEAAFGTCRANMTLIKRRLGWINHYTYHQSVDALQHELVSLLLKLQVSQALPLSTYTSEDVAVDGCVVGDSTRSSAPDTHSSSSSSSSTSSASSPYARQCVYYVDYRELAAKVESKAITIDEQNCSRHRILIDNRPINCRAPSGFTWMAHRALTPMDQFFVYLAPHEVQLPLRQGDSPHNPIELLSQSAPVIHTTTESDAVQDGPTTDSSAASSKLLPTSNVSAASTLLAPSPVPAQQGPIPATSPVSAQQGPIAADTTDQAQPTLSRIPTRTRKGGQASASSSSAPSSSNSSSATMKQTTLTGVQQQQKNKKGRVQKLSATHISAAGSHLRTHTEEGEVPPTHVNADGMMPAPTPSPLPVTASSSYRATHSGGSLFTPPPIGHTATWSQPLPTTPPTPISSGPTHSASSSPTPCLLSLEDIVTLFTSGRMGLLSDLCTHCAKPGSSHLARSQHPLYATATPVSATTDTPRTQPQSLAIDTANVPSFSPSYSRNERNRLRDPDRYLEAVDHHVQARNYHRSVWELVLFHGCIHEADRRWVQNELVNKGHSWATVQQLFLAKFASTSIMDGVYREWNRIHHKLFKTADAYVERCRYLLRRMGSSETDPAVILHVENRFMTRFAQKLYEEKQHRKVLLALQTSVMESSAAAIATTTAIGNATEFRFDSLHSLHEVVRQLEAMYPYLIHRDRPYSRARRNDDRYEASDNAPLSISKLEPSSSGTPQRIGGKRSKQPIKKRVSFSDRPAAIAATFADPLPAAPAVAAYTPAAAASVSATSSPAASPAPSLRSSLSPRRPNSPAPTSAAQSRPTCGTCGKQGHTTAEHRDDYVPPPCAKCNGRHATHKHARLTQRPSVIVRNARLQVPAYIPIAPALSPVHLRTAPSQRTCAFITSTALGDASSVFRNILMDTGGDISCINKQLVHKFNLSVTAPQHVTYLSGFSSSSPPVPRQGTVKLRVTVHLPLEKQSTITFDKTFEVTDMTDDFLLGRDVLPTLFPHDTTLRYCKPHSPITDVPHNVVGALPSTEHGDSDVDEDSDPDVVCIEKVAHAAPSSSSSSQ
jgi:hypothetical protein